MSILKKVQTSKIKYLLVEIKIKKKKTLWPLFYEWGSTTSRLEPIQGGSLLFTNKFPEIPGINFISDLWPFSLDWLLNLKDAKWQLKSWGFTHAFI